MIDLGGFVLWIPGLTSELEFWMCKASFRVQVILGHSKNEYVFCCLLFIALQILDRIEDVQELIFTKEPDLLRALLPVQTMHLTIIVAHLGTEEEVKK